MDFVELFLPSIPVAEIVIRGTVMFLALFAMLRIVGKREAGVHSLTDLLVVVLVAQAAANGMAGNTRSIGDSVLLIGTVLFWSVALDALAYYSPRARAMLKSQATPVIVDGRIQQHVLRREFMNHDELMQQLRLHGITKAEEVECAYLEANGMVSVIRKDHREEERPQKNPAV